ncbi:MAG: hypothetical protein PHE33_12965 [Bacteroidales bacterium]|nr:hypothetical protein [Bacteroidales bacterium]
MLDKIVKILGWVVIGAAALIGILFFVQDANTLEAALETMTDMPADMKILAVENTADSWGALVLNASIVLFVLCALMAVGFAIYKFVVDAIDNPKSAIKPAIAVGGVALLVIISYSLASDAIPVFLGADNFDVTASTSKNVDTAIFGMYILLGITVVALVYTEISRIWR